MKQYFAIDRAIDRNEARESLSLTLAFIAGGIAGALGVLFFTPLTGPQARARLRELSEDLQEGSLQYVDTTCDNLAGFLNRCKEILDGVLAGLGTLAGPDREYAETKK